MSKEGKVTIVVAASKGMGAAISRKLHSEGHRLILMSRSDAIYKISDELNARPFKGSVDDLESLTRLVQFTIEKYGRIDSIVINSGHAAKGELLELPIAEWKKGFDMLFLSTVHLTSLISKQMKSQGSGSIVCISTFGAKEPSLNFPISSSLRSALSSFVKLAATELAPFNIRINSVLPGFIDSYPASEETINQIPMLRQGKPDEVADLVNFLVSEESSYLTGQNILIDGGLTKSI